MFHDEFYPTPEPVIQRMLAPYRDMHGKYSKLEGKTVLDPSAGSGNLLAHIHANLGYHKPIMHAVEPNPRCRTLLDALGYVRLVGDDFLRFTPEDSYDLILMNPPFSNGAKHLLRAWELMQRGDVVCLLNASTLENDHSRERQLLNEIISQHGSVELLGPVFSSAERPTDVHVALVRLVKADAKDPFAFWNDSYFARERFSADFTEEALDNLPAVNDIVASMVAQYRQVETVFVDYLKAYRRLAFHAGSFMERPGYDLPKSLERCHLDSSPLSMLKGFMHDLSASAWRSIIVRSKLEDLMTQSVRRDFDELQKSQQAMAFTEENIHALFNLLRENRHKILHRSVEESFDLMTRYHAYNRVHTEGWKSNEAFAVAPKVVLPNMVRLSISGSTLDIDYYRENTLDDIDRGVAMVAGRKLQQVRTIKSALCERFKTLKLTGGPIPDNTCTSEFFHIRFFLKGTIHLTWLDAGLRQRFNRAAAACKNWLPMDHARHANGAPSPKADAEHVLDQLLLAE